MNKLPLEVALLILNQLSLHDKQECAQTCRAWCTYMRSNGLFEKITLRANTAEDFLSMIHFFQDTSHGKSVLDLSVHMTTIRLENFVRLPDTFPNITALNWVGDIPLNSLEDTETFEMAVSKWKHIKAIDDASTSHQMATALLTETSTAAQIEDITLVYPVTEKDEDDDFDGNHEPPIDVPLNFAQNAQSLTLINLRTTVNEMRMASNLLKPFTILKLLNLDYSAADDDETDDDIAYGIREDYRSFHGEEQLEQREREDILAGQLRNVQHLEVTVDISRFEMNYLHKWTKYFSEAFLNLQSFTFKCSDSAIPPVMNSQSLYDEIDIMYGNQTLKKYCMEFSSLSQSLFEEMEEHKIALEDLTVFFNRQSVDQLVQLKNSSQIKSIKRLTIKEREKYITNGVYGLDMFRLLECIPQLEAVEINTFRGSFLQHNPTVIVSVLNSAPHIKSFKAPALLSLPGDENTVVSQPCGLVHLDISYCQFKLTTLGAQKINQTFKNIMNNCPFLETFSTQVNAYKDETSTDTSIALVFSFTEQPYMKRIEINSLYETYFKFIINGKTSYYHQKHGEMRCPVPDVDKTKVCIQIEARDPFIIETSVMSETP